MSHKLLLCDDELHIVRAAEFKFRRAGFDVRTAADGEEGWAKIKEDCPDLLVTDYQMPRLDGLGLIQRIRSTPETAHMPVIMLSAKGFELSGDELIEKHGITALMHKPFSPRELLTRVQEVLQNAAAEAAST